LAFRVPGRYSDKKKKLDASTGTSLEAGLQTKAKDEGAAVHSNLKPDLSILVIIKHFYFGLTCSFGRLDKKV
jgi:hypothetical protein